MGKTKAEALDSRSAPLGGAMIKATQVAGSHGGCERTDDLAAHTRDAV